MPKLEVRDVVMQFPAVRALDGVSLEFEKGEVHGIVGENGAGKSTLMRILAGLQAPTSGSVSLDGRPVRLRNVGEALRAGIAMIHQELNLVDSLSAAENIYLGREPTRAGVLNRKRMEAGAREYLEQVGAGFGPEVELGSLSIAGKQLVEIAKALSYEASVLIMDEPTAVLSEAETAKLFALIEALREQGVAVLYISHRLAEVEAICDRISVLRDGRLVRTVRRGEAGQSELASLMVGRPMADMFPPKSFPPENERLLSYRDLSDGERVRGVDLELRPGEIVGVAGLIGSGRTELAEILAGIRRGRAGKGSAQALPKSPKQAAKHGVAYVSEDRKETGLVLSMNVIENVTLPNLDAYARPFLQKQRERDAAQSWVKRLDIRAHDLQAPVLYLSGGNQQKVSLAKWLELGPRVLLLDEPTRGVDVGAKGELYRLIHGLAQEGMACLVISSELPELIGLCHRVVVMRSGQVVGEVRGEDMTEEKIMILAAGVRAA
jgi:ribose transport system ATP-binding protein